MKHLIDGVFMGGGVRGIGYAGAIKALHEAEYDFKNVAGVSVGAIIASLVAAGYQGDELEQEMKNIDYKRFKGKGHFGLVSNLFDFRRDYGIYNSDYFEKWLAELLARKNIFKFKDLEYLEKGKVKNRLTLAATDIFKRKLIVLPRDLADYGINPREFEVAKAVRMSMSIPLFYHPYKLVDSKDVEHWIVDGGLLCNYPMWIFDDGSHKLKRPVFGFKFDSCTDHLKPKDMYDVKHEKKRKEKLHAYILRIADLVLDSQNLQYSHIIKGDEERTINISVVVDKKVVSPIDFGLHDKTATALSNNGYAAAQEFLKKWDFKKWVKKYR